MSRLDDLDSLISNLDEEEKENLEKAKRAAEEKIRAEQAAETAKINKAKIEEAKAKYQEAQNIVGSLGIKYEGDANVPSKKSQNFLGKVSNLRFVSGFLAGVVALSLLGGAYLLGRKSYTGTIRNSNSISQTADDYEELTDEKFYELVDENIKKCRDKGISFDDIDMTYLVMNANTSRLCVDNPNLIKNIVGNDSLDYIYDRADSLLDGCNSYNKKHYIDTGDTSGFIFASDFIFDPSEKQIAKEFESDIAEILNSSNNDDLNKALSSFLEEMYTYSTDNYNLDPSTHYVLRFSVRILRDLDGILFELYDANKDFIKYFVYYVGDDEKYYDNGWGTNGWNNNYSIANGVIENQNCKTLTK